MLSIGSDVRIFVFTGVTDMRKSFVGLCGLVYKFDENPVDGSLYVFSNRHRNRLKILFWDGDGFVLWYKHLQKNLKKSPASRYSEERITGHHRLIPMVVCIAEEVTDAGYAFRWEND